MNAEPRDGSDIEGIREEHEDPAQPTSEKECLKFSTHCDDLPAVFSVHEGVWLGRRLLRS